MNVEDAARYYLAMVEWAQNATGPEFMAAQMAHQDALHELIQACDVPCFLCDPGTCPHTTERILVGYEYRPVENTEPL